jgi:hypothetical protein
MPPATTASPGSGATGAATAREAVTAFMTAAKAEDLQALAAVWGTTDGSVRDQLSRSELEMREIYIMKCLRHDKYEVISDATAGSGGRVIAVQVTKGNLTRSTNFTVVPGPQNRWYVFNLELEKLNDICLLR